MDPKRQVSGPGSSRSIGETRIRTRRRSSSSSRLFVLQKHEGQQPHYNLRLEMNGVLAGWAIPHGLSLDPEQKRAAFKIEDRPVHSARFEGSVSDADGRAARLIVWDIGRWELLSNRGLKNDLTEGRLTFLLRGKRLHGVWMLTQEQNSINWQLRKEKDKFACSGPKSEISAYYSGSVIRAGAPEQVIGSAPQAPENSLE